MNDRPKYIANSLLFAVIFALLLQPLAGTYATNQSPIVLADDVDISYSVQNEWTESAGTASGGTGSVIWPDSMAVDSAGDVLVGGMVIGDAAFGSHGSSSDIFGTG